MSLPIAERYVNTEMYVLMLSLRDKEISSGVLQTYMCLRSIAIGENEVVFHVPTFLEFFDLKRGSFYRHLSLLAKSAILRYGNTGSKTTGFMRVEFILDQKKTWSELWLSLNSETALNTTTTSFNLIKNTKVVVVKEGGCGGESLKSEKVSDFGQLAKVFEQEVGALTPMIAEELTEMLDTFPDGWPVKAIREARRSARGGVSPKYIWRILDRWKSEGLPREYMDVSSEQQQEQPVMIELPNGQIVEAKT